MILLDPPSTEQRLVVAADFGPPDGVGKEALVEWAADQLGDLARDLAGTGVCVKINSVLRLLGHGRANKILRRRGLAVFDDLKLCDIPETLATDASYLASDPPDMLTVMCDAGVAAMRRVKSFLRDTLVLGVTVLTSVDEQECASRRGHGVMAEVSQLADMAAEAGLDGVVCSSLEASFLRERHPGLRLVIPGIRPSWTQVRGDDQRRVATPREAIEAGATFVVIGRPIMGAGSRYQAVRQTLAEIEEGLCAVRSSLPETS
jgi:orotidine-5'-phosphate decarboxylase